MGAHLQRGRLLFQSGRHDLALQEFQEELAENPGCATTHTLMALSLRSMNRLEPALEMARTAVGLAPHSGFPQYALARVHSARGEMRAASEAVDEAIRLDPEDADYRALRAGFLYDQMRWRESLASAEEGLRFDPAHSGCQNLRGMSLTKLGRRTEAEESLLGTLQQHPDNAHAHAARGWSLLESRDVKGALEHFDEALHLDPNFVWAREGLVAALKARHVLYRWILPYFLWSARNPRHRFVLVAGVMLGARVLVYASKMNPALLLVAGPLMAAWVLFVVATWVANPLFNLLLLLHPRGRHALNADQRRVAVLVGSGMLGATIVGVLAALRAPQPACMAAAGVAALILTFASAATHSPGRARKVLYALAVVAAFFVLIAVAHAVVANAGSRELDASVALGLGGFSALVSILLARFLRYRARRATTRASPRPT